MLAYRHLPIEDQRQLHSTNPLKRLAKTAQAPLKAVYLFAPTWFHAFQAIRADEFL
jgi:hypothetical protein